MTDIEDKSINKQGPPAGKSMITEGMLLAVSSLIAWAAAVQVESGYASYFGYPQSFIRLEITDVVVTWVRMAIGFVLAFGFVLALLTILPTRQTRLVVGALWMPALLAVFAAGIWAEPTLGAYGLWLGRLCTAFAATIAGWRLVLPAFQRRPTGYWNRVEAIAAEWRKERDQPCHIRRCSSRGARIKPWDWQSESLSF